MFRPGLSPRWESGDAGEAFSTRFGFSDFQEGVSWLSSTLETSRELTGQRCDRILISDQNAIAWLTVEDQETGLICKWSRDRSKFEKLAATADLIASLDKSGIPVACPIPSRDGRRRVEAEGPLGSLSLSVQPEIDGHPLDVSDALAVREAGVNLAQLHLAVAGLSTSPAKDTAGTPALDLHKRISGWMDSTQVDPVALAPLRQELAKLPPLTAMPQLIHNDYRAANILTKASRIAGILDFDEIAWDYCVSDLAHAGTFLATLFRNWGPTPSGARQQFFEGYQAERALTDSESVWLDFLTRWYGLAAGWPTVGPGGDRA